MGNIFGTLFRVTTFGESHGPGVGVVIDGCPSGIALSADDIQHDLDRRRPGQSSISTPRQESDTAEILSGVFEGKTLGTPISILVRNSDAKSKDYDHNRDVYRPSHADYTYDQKFGLRDHRGGGRASARETVGRVAAGTIAKKILKLRHGIEILAYVKQVRQLEATIDALAVTADAIEASAVRCPDAKMAEKMLDDIKKARKAGDSLGGVVECVVKNVPTGIGEPVFDKLEAELGHAMLSIPACKGFEVGSGFGGTRLMGSEHNDPYYQDNTGTRTRTNHSGGIQGGISNGEPIIIRMAFKPTATIMQKQQTVDKNGNETTIKGRGRHDPCVLPRAVPIVEAMVAIVLQDQTMRQAARGSTD